MALEMSTDIPGEHHLFLMNAEIFIHTHIYIYIDAYMCIYVYNLDMDVCLITIHFRDHEMAEFQPHEFEV